MVTWCVIMCPGAGPLIETITVKFKTRADCGDWHDKISGQIRAARQSAVLPSKLSLQPVPPPHVSNCFLLGFHLSLLVTLTLVMSYLVNHGQMGQISLLYHVSCMLSMYLHCMTVA